MRKRILQISLLFAIGVFLNSSLFAQKRINERVNRATDQGAPKTEALGRGLGDDCSNPYIIEVDAIPFTFTDSTQTEGTCGHGNNYEPVLLEYYGLGEDVVYKLEVPQEAQANITLIGAPNSDNNYFHAVAIFQGCPDNGILIAQATAGVFEPTLTLSQALAPNTEYYVLIDYWALPDDPCLQSYDLTIEFSDEIVPVYNLYVADEQVSAENAQNLSAIEGVSGTVTYDNESKTLTLNNATIEGSIGIKNLTIDDLKIQLIGANTINSTNSMGTCLMHYASTEITGEEGASLSAMSAGSMGIYMYESPLSIRNCAIETSGASWGIVGEGKSNDNLLIENASVKATGSTKGSIADITSLTLNNCAITAPAGAAFDADLLGVALGDSLVKEQVVIQPITSVQKPNNTAGFSIYPNPAVDFLKISLDNAIIEGVELQVYDVLGKLMQRKEISNKDMQLDIKDLDKGVYILKIGNKVQRFIKE